MAYGVKKSVDPTLLSHTMWAGWGVIDIETLDRQARRNFINTVRAELGTRGYVLDCGGRGQRPYYAIRPLATQTPKTFAATSRHAFRDVCKLFLQHEDPAHAEPDGSAVTG